MVADLHTGEHSPAPGAPRAGVCGSSPHRCREIGSAPALVRPPDERSIIDWRGFHSALRRAALVATQSGAPLSLLMLDLVPDGLDPPTSDSPPVARPIEALAGVIATEIGPPNALARYGEERLAVILKGVDLSEALLEAERIGRSITPQHGDRRPAGAVIGVAQFRDDESLGHLIERVTDALGRARSDGRQVAAAEHQLRRRPRHTARGTDATLCPCGLYTSPCACGLV